MDQDQRGIGPFRRRRPEFLQGKGKILVNYSFFKMKLTIPKTDFTLYHVIIRISLIKSDMMMDDR